MTVDRTKTTPFLLPIFYSQNKFNSPKDFASADSLDRVDIHTWKDCTLRELISVASAKVPSLSSPKLKASLRLVYPEPKDTGYLIKELGTVYNFRNQADDNNTLGDCRFAIGDFIDIKIELDDNKQIRDSGRRWSEQGQTTSREFRKPDTYRGNSLKGDSYRGEASRDSTDSHRYSSRDKPDIYRGRDREYSSREAPYYRGRGDSHRAGRGDSREDGTSNDRKRKLDAYVGRDVDSSRGEGYRDKADFYRGNRKVDSYSRKDDRKGDSYRSREDRKGDYRRSSYKDDDGDRRRSNDGDDDRKLDSYRPADDRKGYSYRSSRKDDDVDRRRHDDGKEDRNSDSYRSREDRKGDSYRSHDDRDSYRSGHKDDDGDRSKSNDFTRKRTDDEERSDL